MSALADQLTADLKEAMRAQDEFRVGVLRMVKSELKNQEIAAGAVLADDQVLAIVRKEVKKRRETAEVYTKAGSTDRATHETTEAELIEKYLPTAPAFELVVAKATELFATGEYPVQQRGILIKAVVEAFPGTVDGSLAAKAVGAVLAQ